MRIQLRPLARAALVGIAGGLSAVLFRLLLSFLVRLITGHSGPLAEVAAVLPIPQRVLIPCAGGLLATLVLHYGPRFYRGEHPADYLEAVKLGDGRIPVRPALWRSAASVISIVTGAAIGREGSMVQISALAASLLGKRWTLPPERLRLCVACGVAAGIATAYKAPLAGAFFASEIVLGALTLADAGPLLVAAAVGAGVAQLILGSTPTFPVSAVPPFTAAMILPGLLLAAAAGLIVPVYRRWLTLFEFLRKWPVPLLWGGLTIGLLSIYRPEVWGNGETAIQQVLRPDATAPAVLSLLAFRLVATAASAGSGAIGGVFTPTLFFGAVVGWCAGSLTHALGLPAGTMNGYVLLGMACILAGATHAPLMSVLITMELTGNATLVIPMLLGSVLAWQISRVLWPQSLYTIASPQPLSAELEMPTRSGPAAGTRLPDPAARVPADKRRRTSVQSSGPAAPAAPASPAATPVERPTATPAPRRSPRAPKT